MRADRAQMIFLCFFLCGCNGAGSNPPVGGNGADLSSPPANDGGGADLATPSGGDDLSIVSGADLASGNQGAPDLAGGHQGGPDLAGADLGGITGPCPPLVIVNWKAGAFQQPSDNNLYINLESGTTGIADQILLYVGPPSQLMPLPKTRTIACGNVPCDSSFVSVQGASDNYYLYSGTITLEQVTTPLSTEVHAKLSNLIFRQVQTVPLDGGAEGYVFAGPGCASIDQDIDTSVPIGQPCQSVTDCGTFGKACDMQSNQCEPSECKSDSDCGAGRACIVQNYPTANSGVQANACYSICNPNMSGACGSGTCLRRPDMPSTVGQWICYDAGNGPLGGTCDGGPNSNSTGCQTGLVSHYTVFGCVCTQACNEFAANPGCGTMDRCRGGGCEMGPFQYTDPAALGGTCASSGPACGDDGKTFRGVCDNNKLCRKLCELGTTCSTGACVTDFSKAPEPTCP